MNDLSHNKYLDGYGVDFADYNLDAFLNKEIAVEYLSTTDEILLAMGVIANVCGCNVHLLGTRLLIDLVAAYVTKADFSKSDVLQSIARAHKLNVPEVTDNILACLRYADNFSEKVKHLLKTSRDIDSTDISDITVALGAVFKIYFNYKAEEETFEFESRNTEKEADHD